MGVPPVPHGTPYRRNNAGRYQSPEPLKITFHGPALPIGCKNVLRAGREAFPGLELKPPAVELFSGAVLSDRQGRFEEDAIHRFLKGVSGMRLRVCCCSVPEEFVPDRR